MIAINPAPAMLLPLSDAAKLLGVPVFTIRRWCKEGHLPYIQSGIKYYIPKTEIDKFLTKSN